jgi:MoxR-like ATPase
LSAEERTSVADPSGEGKISNDAGRLKRLIASWRQAFTEQLKSCPKIILDYTTAVVSHLNAAGLRVSPRRSRLLARSLLAASIVNGKTTDRLFRQVLECSLPHMAWGVEPKKETVLAAHRASWDTSSQTHEAWVHAFMAEATLSGKLKVLLDECKSKDQGSQAVAQFLASEPRERAAAFSFAIYPAAAMGKLPVGSDGVSDLARVASPILSVDGEISWQERISSSNTQHPDFSRYAQALAKVKGARAQRARQFFNWCLVNKVVVADPEALETDLNACVSLLKTRKMA